ncbi:MAG: hypothetical protein AAF206_07810 [Bacteroidota bacterium]
MGAGGTKGGTGRFLLGLIMTIGGGYLLLNAINVSNHFAWGHSLYRIGSIGITSGMIMIPFILGIGMVFYSAKNVLGWLLAGGSFVAMIFGVISSVHFSFERMTAFELILILVLFVGGIGLLLNSLKRFG